MTTNECINLLVPALLNLYGEASVQNAIDLDKKLGVTEYHNYSSINFGETSMPTALAELYRQLAGPHGKTILKAYRIKKGLEHADVSTT